MHSILMTYATHPTPGPGVFKIAGNAAPSIIGQTLHWIARLSLIICLVLVLVILKFRERTPVWQLIIVLVLGAVVLPHTSQKVASSVNTVTSGDTVASTGASIGLIALAIGLLVVTVLVPPVLRKRAAGGGGDEGSEG